MIYGLQQNDIIKLQSMKTKMKFEWKGIRTVSRTIPYKSPEKKRYFIMILCGKSNDIRSVKLIVEIV